MTTIDYSSSPYYAQAVQAANNWGVPPSLFVQQIGAESGFNPSAYNSKSGATGIAQFLPSTAAQAGYGIPSFDPTDPNASLDAAAHYDAALYQKTGSWSGALGAYQGNSSGSPYAGFSGVTDLLGSNMGGVQNAGLSWSNLFPSWAGGSGGPLGGSLLDLLSPTGTSVLGLPGQAPGASGDKLPVIPAVKRALLFILAVVIIGVGLWMLGGNDFSDLASAIKSRVKVSAP